MNIQKLLDQIKEYGMTDSQIGAAVNAPQSIITRLRNGTHKHTSYERTIKIKELAE